MTLKQEILHERHNYHKSVLDIPAFIVTFLWNCSFLFILLYGCEKILVS